MSPVFKNYPEIFGIPQKYHFEKPDERISISKARDKAERTGVLYNVQTWIDLRAKDSAHFMPMITIPQSTNRVKFLNNFDISQTNFNVTRKYCGK